MAKRSNISLLDAQKFCKEVLPLIDKKYSSREFGGYIEVINEKGTTYTYSVQNEYCWRDYKVGKKITHEEFKKVFTK